MKQKISVASGSLKPKDMSRNHYTTLGFGSVFPIYCEEVVPKDKVNLKVSNFSRLAPMYLPNLGSIEMKLHSFYVPFRLVWNHFDNFKEGLPSWNSNGAQVYKHVPMISDRWLTHLFIANSDANQDNPDLCWCEVNAFQGGQYDFILSFTSGGTNFTQGYVLTTLGKNILHVLYSLGYNFNWTYEDTYGATYSALPLLCWFKMYLDYFIPSQFQPSSYIHSLFLSLHEESAVTLDSVLSDSYFTSFSNCFNQCQYFYQNNYFTSAWQSPNAVVSGLNNIGSTASDRPQINSISSQGSTSSTFNQNVQNSDNYVSRPSGTSSGINSYSGVIAQQNSLSFTSDGLSFIQKFARFVRRSNFAGSRVIERILARYGVRVDDFQIGMSKYLGNQTLNLQKSDVTSTSSNNQEDLGDFAGKSWFSAEGRPFKCDCDYFGMVIVTASLVTPSSYVTGMRRRNFHTQPLDYWTPELDGGTMQAISGAELYGRETYMATAKTTMDNMGLYYGSTFGFTPRYSEYKGACSLDDVTGDFSLPRLSANIDGFILPRRLFDEHNRYIGTAAGNAPALYSDCYDTGVVLDEGSTINKVTPSSMLFGNDMWQFNRIFRKIDGTEDPVFSVFKIDCIINSPTLPLNESSELIAKGKVLDFETNGSHL